MSEAGRALTFLDEQDIECPVHGAYRGKPFKAAGFLGRSPSIHYPECPRCESEGNTRGSREGIKRRDEREIEAMKAMRIDPLFWKSGFENFNAYNDELKHHLGVARSFSENPDGKLVMIGENGNGKNHLAVSILKKTGGLYYLCFEIGVLLRDCYNGGKSERDVFERLCSTPLLIIDEVEKIKESEAQRNWMSYVVNKRYANMLPIIFMANCHTQQDCRGKEKPCPKCLEYHLENDILSRITQDGIILKFTSGDYRDRLGAEYRSRKRAEHA